MFCGKCGKNNSDDAMFCRECGAPLQAYHSPGGDAAAHIPSSTQASHHNRLVGIIAVAAVALVALIAGFSLFGGRSPDAAVTQLVDAVFDADGKAIVALMPETVLKLAAEEGYSRQDLIDELEAELDSQLYWILSYAGDDWSVSCKVGQSDDVSNKELRALQDEYKEYDTDISAAKTVEAQITFTSEEYDNTSTIEVPVVKVGRSWYIDILNFDLNRLL